MTGQDECLWSFYSCNGDEPPQLPPQVQQQSSKQNVPHGRQLQSELIGLRPQLPPLRQGSALELRQVPLSGSLPAELALLSSSLAVLAIHTTTTTDSMIQDQALDDKSGGGSGGLAGPLPSELGKLTHLVVLDLHNNLLTSMIPSELGLLSQNLQALYLHNNAFAPGTTIPKELCQIKMDPNAALEEITVDCDSVECDCACICGASDSSQPDETSNIFDHGGIISTGAVVGNSTASATFPLGFDNATNYTSGGSIETAVPNSTIDGSIETAVTNSSDDGSLLLCNGLPNLCDFRLPEILFPMVHNAMASAADEFLVPNHLLPLEEAIAAGYRGINLDLCQCEDKLVFCHSSCVLRKRDPAQVLSNLHQFLLDNPHEVLVFALEVNPVTSTGQPIDIWEFYQMIRKLDGNFIDMMYVHEPPNEPWPTLRALIETNKVCLIVATKMYVSLLASWILPESQQS